MRRSSIVGLSMLICLYAFAQRAYAYGEAVNGFPSWNERVLLEWMNRSRSDPQADLGTCPSGNCLEAACYTPSSPRYISQQFEHSSRFHSAHMLINNYFTHPSACTLVANIGSLYPTSCDGSAACSCVGGTLTGSTDPFVRMSYFGSSSGNGEIIAAGYPSPDATYYAWLYEPASTSACGFSSANGHRFLLLMDGYGQTGGGGYMLNTGQAGIYSTYATMDFGGSAPTPAPKIPSGSHFPQQAASVDAWVNWYDTAAPSVKKIDVDGICTDMSLTRGTTTNGAWHMTVNNVGSGCHHYMFAFKDSSGNEVIYPTAGALTIGNGSAQCPDYSLSPPPGCAGFDRIFANGFEP
jgi:hypothetical protein